MLARDFNRNHWNLSKRKSCCKLQNLSLDVWFEVFADKKYCILMISARIPNDRYETYLLSLQTWLINLRIEISCHSSVANKTQLCKFYKDRFKIIYYRTKLKFNKKTYLLIYFLQVNTVFLFSWENLIINSFNFILSCLWGKNFQRL